MNKILGVKIDAITLDIFKNKISEFLRSNKFNQVATVNPEFLVDAQSNKEFKEILNNTDLNLVDGFGLQLAYFLKYKKIPQRLPGVDIVDTIFSICAQEDITIFLLGGGNQAATLAKNEILKEYPFLKIFTLAGGKIEKNNDFWTGSEEILNQINISQAQVLLVGLGHPKQELWIADHKKNLPFVRIAVGVGGTFDYISKQVKRAPLFYRRLGLEWLYRLYQQPWRWQRIIKAVFIFTYLFFTKHEKTIS